MSLSPEASAPPALGAPNDLLRRAGQVLAALAWAALWFGPATAAADATTALKAFIPPSARMVVGMDLAPADYGEASALATLFIQQDPLTRQGSAWLEKAQVTLRADAAMVLEDDEGRTAVLLRYGDLRDSHWLRLEAIMRAYGMVEAPAPGATLWRATEATFKDQGDLTKLGVARLNEETLAFGDVELLAGIANAARRRQRPRGALRELMAQVPRLATFWVVAVERGEREASPDRCTKGVNAFAALDDGLLLEARWQCADADQAQRALPKLREDFAALMEAGDIARLEERDALRDATIIQRIGEDLILVMTADDATVRALLKSLM